MTKAKRFIKRPVELREDGDGRKISGYGAVFYNADDEGTQFQLWEDAYERILPGAFDRAIAEDDVRSLFNHDVNIVLGRNTSGTLALSVDEVGLRYEITAPDTQLVRDQVVAPIERGDVSGSSFMFVPIRANWTDEDSEDGRSVEIREVREVELWEVGPVVFPAYDASTSSLRQTDIAEARSERDEWRTAMRREREAVLVRARVVEIENTLDG
jgi:HK97 family phage prohead protease